MTSRYDSLGDLILRYSNLKRDLELSLRLRREDDDLAEEIDFLSDRIATLQKQQDECNPGLTESRRAWASERVADRSLV